MLLATLVGGYLAAGGAGAINHYIERDIDARMSRTSRRPLPSGRIEPRAALWFGIALGALSFALFALAVNMTAALLAMAGLLGYVFVYTLWLKPRTTQNIVIGGAAGAVPPLVGWAAATGSLDAVGVLPVRDRLLLDAAALLGARAADQGRLRAHGHPDAAGRRRRGRDPAPDPALRLAAARDHGAAGRGRAVRRDLRGRRRRARALVFLWLCVRLYRRADRRSAALLFHYSLAYLALLFCAMAIDRVL